MGVPILGGQKQMLVAMISTGRSLAKTCRWRVWRKGLHLHHKYERRSGPACQSYGIDNNLFQSMQNVSFTSGYSLDAMKNDIADQKEGMTEYRDFNVEKYAYYRPMGINGWYVVSTVPAGVITARTAVLSQNLIHALYCIHDRIFGSYCGSLRHVPQNGGQKAGDSGQVSVSCQYEP